jgi:translation initiation factor IF-2
MANLRIIRAGIGDVVASDVFLAETAKASILGYGVSVHRAVKPKVELRTYDTLQAVVEEARRMLEEALPPLEVEKHLGRVEIRKVIKSSKVGRIAGCFVLRGIVRRNAVVRLIRDEIVLWQGKLASLKRFKDEAKEVRENFECGIKLAGRSDIKEGDILEVIEIKKVKQRLAS